MGGPRSLDVFIRYKINSNVDCLIKPRLDSFKILSLLGLYMEASPCGMSVLRNGHVVLSNLRKSHVAMLILRKFHALCHYLFKAACR